MKLSEITITGIARHADSPFNKKCPSYCSHRHRRPERLVFPAPIPAAGRPRYDRQRLRPILIILVVIPIVHSLFHPETDEIFYED